MVKKNKVIFFLFFIGIILLSSCQLSRNTNLNKNVLKNSSKTINLKNIINISDLQESGFNMKNYTFIKQPSGNNSYFFSFYNYKDSSKPIYMIYIYKNKNISITNLIRGSSKDTYKKCIKIDSCYIGKFYNLKYNKFIGYKLVLEKKGILIDIEVQGKQKNEYLKYLNNLAKIIVKKLNNY